MLSSSLSFLPCLVFSVLLFSYHCLSSSSRYLLLFLFVSLSSCIYLLFFFFSFCAFLFCLFFFSFFSFRFFPSLFVSSFFPDLLIVFRVRLVFSYILLFCDVLPLFIVLFFSFSYSLTISICVLFSIFFVYLLIIISLLFLSFSSLFLSSLYSKEERGGRKIMKKSKEGEKRRIVHKTK